MTSRSSNSNIVKIALIGTDVARLAQSVERWTLNPTVVGSSPTLGVAVDFLNKINTSYTSAKFYFKSCFANIFNAVT